LCFFHVEFGCTYMYICYLFYMTFIEKYFKNIYLIWCFNNINKCKQCQSLLLVVMTHPGCATLYMYIYVYVNRKSLNQGHNNLIKKKTCTLNWMVLTFVLIGVSILGCSHTISYSLCMHFSEILYKFQKTTYNMFTICWPLVKHNRTPTYVSVFGTFTTCTNVYFISFISAWAYAHKCWCHTL